MIVEIDDQYIEENEEIIDHIRLMVSLLENCHYFSVNDASFEHLNQMMEKYAGKGGYELFCHGLEFFSQSGHMKECLSSVKLSELSAKEIKILLLKPSELLVENSANEWSVYECVIKTYQKDRTYGDVVKYINRRKGIHQLVPANAGGISNIPAIVELKNKGEYGGYYYRKVCVIFDRDTDNDQYFTPNNNRLYELFAGPDKNAGNLTNDDIYKLDFGNGYIWHQWYKRAIENYYPAEKYAEQGMDISILPTDPKEYDYYHFKEPEHPIPHGYKKTMMRGMGKGMSIDSYRERTRTFDIDGGKYDEMLLLMLKIAKIV